MRIVAKYITLHTWSLLAYCHCNISVVQKHLTLRRLLANDATATTSGHVLWAQLLRLVATGQQDVGERTKSVRHRYECYLDKEDPQWPLEGWRPTIRVHWSIINENLCSTANGHWLAWLINIPGNWPQLESLIFNKHIQHWRRWPINYCFDWPWNIGANINYWPRHCKRCQQLQQR